MTCKNTRIWKVSGKTVRIANGVRSSTENSSMNSSNGVACLLNAARRWAASVPQALASVGHRRSASMATTRIASLTLTSRRFQKSNGNHSTKRTGSVSVVPCFQSTVDGFVRGSPRMDAGRVCRTPA